eukprot:TRINITY_DN13404_c0_g1_i1.p1 TRINITY_DN13404_c0_g1~~TRINITY_DN13404_c0_g1_i1.p1  ORF type:complete len:340 (-),score=55.71 TRINITY_DN13404_c0_g1_i1:27-1046(-)
MLKPGGILADKAAALALTHINVCRAECAGLEIRGEATATLDRCALFSNGGQGLIVWHAASHVEAKHTDIHSNQFETGTLIEENVHDAVFESCRFFGNGHAGICSQRQGRLQMRRCEVFSNFEGILVQDTGSAVVEHCTVRDNSNGIFIGYDHVGSATLAHNRVFSNHMKGILLGTGRKKTKLVDNEERDNGLSPGLGGLMPNLRKDRKDARQRQYEMDMRRWAKNMQKSGGSAEKAAKASKEKTPFDYAVHMAGFDSKAYAQEVHKEISSCAYCKKLPEGDKFKKCSGCQMVCYCSPECQKKHWKAGHKQNCVAATKHPSYVDPNRSVDDRTCRSRPTQ